MDINGFKNGCKKWICHAYFRMFLDVYPPEVLEFTHVYSLASASQQSANDMFGAGPSPPKSRAMHGLR